MVEDVRKDLLNIVEMLNNDIEKELAKLEGKDRSKFYHTILKKFLNQYSRKYLIDIHLLDEQHTLYIVPF